MALKLSLQTQIYTSRGKDKVLYPGIEKSKNDQTIRGSPMIKTRMSRNQRSISKLDGFCFWFCSCSLDLTVYGKTV